ncbi:Dynein assembly factor 1 [Diplonema papillatum]|nr:Dynein assembly factor 1 [Diplonema papillatum]
MDRPDMSLHQARLGTAKRGSSSGIVSKKSVVDRIVVPGRPGTTRKTIGGPIVMGATVNASRHLIRTVHATPRPPCAAVNLNAAERNSNLQNTSSSNAKRYSATPSVRTGHPPVPHGSHVASNPVRKTQELHPSSEQAGGGSDALPLGSAPPPGTDGESAVVSKTSEGNPHVANGVMPQSFRVRRSQDALYQGQDRLNLDRRQLTSCPVFEGEERLKLLHMQSNYIVQITNLNLPSLVFLDLYNNNLKKISGLESVASLRVLMLGKNSLKKIEGLGHLSQLDVLDLHNNQIVAIENINHLTELRVLNLAGNQITRVQNMAGLVSLTEVNLRRNVIETVSEIDKLPSLQRIFLSNNAIKSLDAVTCLFRTTNKLAELSLDGNPLVNYRLSVIDRVKSLKHVDLKRVSDDEKRAAALQAKREERAKRVSGEREDGGDAPGGQGSAFAPTTQDQNWTAPTYPSTADEPGKTGLGRLADWKQPPLPSSINLKPFHPEPPTQAEASGNMSSPLSPPPQPSNPTAVPADATTDPAASKPAQAAHGKTPLLNPHRSDPKCLEYRDSGRLLIVHGEVDPSSSPAHVAAAPALSTVVFKSVSLPRLTERFIPWILAHAPGVSSIVITRGPVGSTAELVKLSQLRNLEKLTVTGPLLQVFGHAQSTPREADAVEEVAGSDEGNEDANAAVPPAVEAHPSSAGGESAAGRHAPRELLTMLAPSLKEINGVEVSEGERNAASKRFAAFNLVVQCTPTELARTRRCTGHRGPACSKQPGTSQPFPITVALQDPPSTSDRVSRAYVQSVLSHAATIDSKIQLLNQQWDSILANLVLSAASAAQ